MINKTKVRRSFTIEEDRHLRKLVRKFGSKNKWNEISALMKTRDPRQCRDRWNYYLSPKNNADKWTEEEDKLLFDLYEQRGRKWATFKPFFNGRTTVNIKSRWYFLNRNKNINENNINNNSVENNLNTITAHNITINKDGAPKQMKPQPNKVNFPSLHHFESGQSNFISSFNNQFLLNFNQPQDALNNPQNNLFYPAQNMNFPINQNIYNPNLMKYPNENSFDMTEDKNYDESSPNQKNNIFDFDVNIDDFDEFINSLFAVNEH